MRMKSISIISGFLAVLSISLEGQQVHSAPPIDILIGSVMGVSALDVGGFNNDGDIDIMGENKHSTDSRPFFYENLIIE